MRKRPFPKARKTDDTGLLHGYAREAKGDERTLASQTAQA
jgi:hypothetical protein